MPPSNVAISPPALGDIVSFSFANRLPNESIVGPTIIRVRTDLTWQDVIGSAAKQRQFMEGIDREARDKRGEGRHRDKER